MLITSFSAKGYVEYGHRMLQSYQSSGQTIPMLVYYEHDQPEKPEIPGVTWMPLSDIRNFKQTEEHLSKPEFQGQVKNTEGEMVYNFRFDAWKFFRKVFAINDAYSNASRSTKFLAWVDADVEFIRPIPDTLMTLVLPRNEVIAYIGRRNMHSECGFMLFNLDEEGPLRRFMMNYWALYGTGAFTSCNEWHDSYLFDHARALSAISAYSLTGDQCESLYPWDETILSDWMVHNKGPERKEKAYADAA